MSNTQQLSPQLSPNAIINNAQALRWQIGGDFHDKVMETTYAEAAAIADSVVTRPDEEAKYSLDQTIDRLVTSRTWGFPIMIGLFALVFWITIVGANYPSQMLMNLLIGRMLPILHNIADALRMPWWLSGLLIDGMYLSTAWVISVMLPPMAIFFPLFTLLEDFGYLPRVAFNLDSVFKKSGAHGKQSLSMMMGFGCNAAGVIATRIIDSPRERLIAMITNNFARTPVPRDPFRNSMAESISCSSQGTMTATFPASNSAPISAMSSLVRPVDFLKNAPSAPPRTVVPMIEAPPVSTAAMTPTPAPMSAPLPVLRPTWVLILSPSLVIVPMAPNLM